MKINKRKQQLNRKKLSLAISLALSPLLVNAQFNPVEELSDLNGQNGFVINGVDVGDQSGNSVSHAGDINGDGIDDLIIGARGVDTNGSSSGASYVVFGKSSGFDPLLNLSDLNGNNGFVINGVNADDSSGGSVSSAGDVNGDGFDDLIIGATGVNINGGGQYGYDREGASYVVFGKGSNFASTINLSDLNGSDGFVINGVDEIDFLGRSVSSAGDINGDGFDDLIIGAPGGYYSSNKSTSIIFGQSSFDSIISSSDLNGSNGFTVSTNEHNRAGVSVSSAGDVNGDGFDDLIIGASGHADYSDTAGTSYIIFGKSSGFDPELNLSSLNSNNGFAINGVNSYDYSGGSVSNAGDVNGDGFADLIIGARHVDTNGTSSGASYVVFGKGDSFGNILELSDLNGNDGFVINGLDADDFFGVSVSGAGDVNNDGFDDLIIGASGVDSNGSSSGASYVVFGKNSGFGATLSLSDLNGNNGFVVNGLDNGDRLGRSVSSAGDINGDGFVDLIIGATGVETNGSSSGASYILFGAPKENKLTASPTATDLHDLFGSAVSISGDKAIVGAPFDDGEATDAGAAYIYHKIQGQWEQIDRLVASDAQAVDRFGSAVSMDGNRVLIGAFSEDGGTATSGNSGSAYIFELVNDVWVQQVKLRADDAQSGAAFGFSVSLNGTDALVGAQFDDNNGITDTGSAYLFQKESANNWPQTIKLLADDPAQLDRFGSSVAFDGNDAVVGAWSEDGAAITGNSGSVYIFNKDTITAQWAQVQKLRANDAQDGDAFGRSIAIDFPYLIVGAAQDDDLGTDAGSAYVFNKASAAANWNQVNKITASDGEAQDRFGFSVSISGEQALVGAYKGNGNRGFTDSGSAYLLGLRNDDWKEIQMISSASSRINDLFGNAVSLSNNEILIGAPKDDDRGDDSGSAYVFTGDVIFVNGFE